MELGDKDPKRLRVASHESMKKSEEHLTAIISERKARDESASKDRSSVIAMCLHTLVNKVRSSCVIAIQMRVDVTTPSTGRPLGVCPVVCAFSVVP